jgi:hypothetical protein
MHGRGRKNGLRSCGHVLGRVFKHLGVFSRFGPKSSVKYYRLKLLLKRKLNKHQIILKLTGPWRLLEEEVRVFGA